MPKPAPVIVTEVPTLPESGEMLVITAPGILNGTPLLAIPLTVTTTFPLLAVAGTVKTILVALQVDTVAVTPFRVTVLWPCRDPKLTPEIVTDVLAPPDVGDTELIHGAVELTVKQMPLLACPFTKTMTGPVTIPLGTWA